MAQNRRVILFAHPRSGSSSLYQILQLHPALNILEEPFNEGFTQWNSNNPNYLERIHDIPSLDAQLAEIFGTYNGVKVLNYQLPDELGIHLLQRPDCDVLFLRRRNLLQSVVSVRIAEQTNLWKRWDMTMPLEEYYRDLRALDTREVRERVRSLKAHLDFFEAIVDGRSDNAVIKLVYEELYFCPPSERNQQIAAIWRHLGLQHLNSERIHYYLRPESAKLNSKMTYALLPNAQEIEEQCGSDETGWLFD